MMLTPALIAYWPYYASADIITLFCGRVTKIELDMVAKTAKLDPWPSPVKFTENFKSLKWTEQTEPTRSSHGGYSTSEFALDRNPLVLHQTRSYWTTDVSGRGTESELPTTDLKCETNHPERLRVKSVN